MNLKEIIQSQYLAALAMLKQAIIKCPPSAWDAPQDKDKTWFKAYHTLYYVHKYLQPAKEAFVPWKKHHKPHGGELITKEDALEYLAFVEQQVADCIHRTDLEAASEFLGNRLTKVEEHLINIRHIQQHTGELFERLGSRENVKFDWAEQRHNKVKR